MSAAQPAIPFLCAAILAIFIAVRRVREDVAKLALVAWLLGCNIVHAINAAMWSSNLDLKAFAWCDIGMLSSKFSLKRTDFTFLSFFSPVTKLALATTVAIPGACLCISRHLEMVSSSRNLPSGANALRNQRLFDAFFCYLIPLCYLPLRACILLQPQRFIGLTHLEDIVGQNHRFDLIKGIGCMAAVHPSTPASMIVWMPHIIMCVVSILYSGKYSTVSAMSNPGPTRRLLI